jgi:hypothetical protein
MALIEHVSGHLVSRESQTERSLFERCLVFAEVMERLERIEEAIRQLGAQKIQKDWYTPAEVGGIIKRATYTVREWCRYGRVNASKRNCGRGNTKEWMISADELKRIQNEGLLPED